MKRLLAMPLLLLVLATLAWAQGGVEDRARQWQRNRTLFQDLVQGSLRLALEEDSLKRADECSELAERFALALREATATQDGDRVAELGEHLQTLLEEGVAANLTVAAMLPGSGLEQEVKEVQKKTAEILKPLEEELQRSAAAGDEREVIREAIQAVRTGRASVDRVSARKQ
jgi:hypothetical protein